MKKITFLILAIVVISVVIALLFRSHAGFNVTINNETEVDVAGLYLTYNNIQSDIEIPPVGAGERITINVNPTEEFGENSMNLYYKDNNGNIHNEIVFGYFEQGYFGKAVITLEAIDEQGLLTMEIAEKMFE